MVFYFAFAYLAVNPLAKRLLPWVAEHQLASRMQVEQVQFDPLRLTLLVRGLQLTQPNGEALASVQQLFVDVEVSGIRHWAWRFKEILVTQPQANFAYNDQGVFNWGALLAKINEDKTPSTGMPRLLFDHIKVEGGVVSYTEQHAHAPLQVAMQPLNLELEGLSTLPEDAGDYAFSAKLPQQGGTLRWKGELALNPVASKGQWALEGFQLASVMPWLKSAHLPINLDHGSLAVSGQYDFAMETSNDQTKAAAPATQTPKLALSHVEIALNKLGVSVPNATKASPLQLELEALALHVPTLSFSMQPQAKLAIPDIAMEAQQLVAHQAHARYFVLPSLTVERAQFAWPEQHLSIGNIALANAEINLMRDVNGDVDFVKALSAFASHAQAEDPTSKPAAQSKPFTFELENIALQHWKTKVEDHTFAHPLQLAVNAMDVGLAVHGQPDGVRVEHLNVKLADWQLHAALADAPLVTLADVQLHEGTVTLNDQRFDATSLVFSGLKTRLAQTSTQTNNPVWNWQEALAPANIQTSSAPSSAHPQPVASNPPSSKPAANSAWKVGLGKLALEQAELHIEQAMLPAPLVLDLQMPIFEVLHPQLDMSKLDMAKPVAWQTKLNVKQGGQLQATGHVALAPLKGDVQWQLQDLSLKPFSPFINQQALLTMDDGHLSAKGKTTFAAPPAPASMKVAFDGGFSINNLALSEEGSHTPFLAWQEVSSDTVKLRLGDTPNQVGSLHLDALQIVQPVGKFIIFEDKSFNVTRILRGTSSEVKAAASAQPPLQNVKAAENKPATTAKVITTTSVDPFPVTIDRIRVANASLEFADLSLKPQFGTHMNSLNGVINGLGSAATSTAQVELDGKVDEYGSAKIRGAVQPFKATDYTDLKLAFHNLEMKNLTPYSGKFAGRKIESGKLSVDLEYNIKQRQLAGSNKFVINKIHLGERVDSPEAVNLPLDLAIALLEDSKGNIDLDLPISGSLDDPQFSYGKVIWKAVVNVLTKVVTAPFRMLGKLFGGGGEQMEAILFAPGESNIAPEELEKLHALAAGLEKRPAVGISIAPVLDEAKDKLALQTQLARRELLTEMGVALKADEQAGPADVRNPKVQSAIEHLLQTRRGEARSPKALEQLKDLFKKPSAEDEAKYNAMFNQLVVTANISEADLQALANRRASQVQQTLTSEGKLANERVQLLPMANLKGSASDLQIAMPIQLNVAGKHAGNE